MEEPRQSPRPPGPPGPLGRPSAPPAPPNSPVTPGTQARTWAWARAWATEAPASLLLVLLQVALLAWVSAAHGDPTSAAALVAAGALERGRVWSGEWWRLGSAVLLHVGWVHLGLNALFGLGWCRLAERALGAARFLLLYAVAGLSASAASLLAQDTVSAGASGALFGVIGAALALHRRALPGWRDFARSPATVQVAVQLAGWTAVALVGSLPLDHAAHAGGLVAGAACAWLLTAPVRRPATWALLAGALLAASTAACWPRPGPTRFGAEERLRRIHAALRAEDRAAAADLLRGAAAAGLDEATVGYYRGLLAVQEGKLEEAAERLRPVARDAAPAIRAEARRAYAGVTRNLGYRAYTGDGAPLDPEAGLRWFDESCLAGEATSCADAARIRDVRPP